MCKQMARFPNALLCKIPPKTTSPQIKRLIVDSALLWNCVFYFSCFSNQHCWPDERVRWWFCSLSTATKERLPHRDTKAKLPRQGSKPGKPIGLDKASSELSASGSSHSRVCFSPLSRTNCWPTDSPVKLCLAGKLLNLLSNRTNAKVLNHQMCWTTQSTFSPVCLKLPRPSPLSKWCDRRKKKAENNPQCPPWNVTPPRSKLTCRGSTGMVW